MTAQKAILEIVRIFDEGNRDIEQILEIHGMHSLKAGELIPRIERSMMYRIGRLVREYEESADPMESEEQSER